MPEVMTIKRSPPPTWWDHVRVITLLAPPVYLIYLWARGRALHFEDQQINLAAHALLVGLGLLGGWMFSREPVAKETRTERVIATQGNWRLSIPDWWSLLPLMPAASVGLVVLADRAAFALVHSAELHTSPGRALFVWLTCAALAALYGQLLLDREEVRVSDEGIRWGITQFAEWSNIARVARRGSRLWVFHSVNADVPFGSVLDYDAHRTEIEPYLARFSIPDDASTRGGFQVVRIGAVIGFLAVTAGALALYRWRVTGAALSVVVALLASFVIAYLLERYRGMYRTTRGKKQTEPAPPPQPSGPNPAREDVHDVTTVMAMKARNAADDARQRFAVELNFETGSVRQVERILDRIHRGHLERPMTERDIAVEALAWGVYVGEVIRTLHPAARWRSSRRDDEPPWLVIADAATSYPVAWCYKRIANGEEDNVWHKFQLLFVATNRLKPQDFAEQ